MHVRSPLRRHPGVSDAAAGREPRRPPDTVSPISGPSLTSELHLTGASVVDLGWNPTPPHWRHRVHRRNTQRRPARVPGFAAHPHPAPARLLAADPPDVVCADSVPLGELLAGIFGAPIVSLVPLDTNTAFTPAGLIDDSPEPSGMGRCFWRTHRLVHLLQPAVPNGHDIDSTPASPSLVFVPGSFRSPLPPSTTAFTSSAIRCHTARRTPPWQPPPSDAPVLLVSLGTAFNNRPDFFATCADVFATSAFHVVDSPRQHIDPAELGTLPT